MGELKPGWRQVKFGGVVRLNKDTSKNPEADGLDRYIGLEHIEPGNLRVRSWGDVAGGTTFTNRFRPGQVLFGKRRAYQRKVAVADFEGVCSGDIYVLESKDHAALVPELLPFICQTDAFFEHAVGTSAGSLSPRTNWKSLAKYEFALPPLEEQRRIARLLDKASKVCDHAHLLKRATERAYAASLASRFPASLAQDRGKTTEALGDLCIRITDGTHQSPPITDSGVPFLLIGNMSSGVVDWNVDKYVSEETYAELTKSFRPSKNDVLYSVVGVSLGVPVLVDWDRPFMFQRHIGVFRCDENRLLPQYLLHFLRSALSDVQDRMYEEGNAQKTVTLSALRSYRIPRPSLKDQREDATELNELAEGVAAALNRIDRTVSFKRMLLEEALA